MNEPQPAPAWPLTLMAFLQTMVASIVSGPLFAADGPWGRGYVAFLGVAGLLTATLVGLAVRNCVRLWRVSPGQTSWALAAAAAGIGFFAGLIALAPMTTGRWRWDSLAWGSLCLFLVVLLVREVLRLVDRVRQSDPSPPT